MINFVLWSKSLEYACVIHEKVSRLEISHMYKWQPYKVTYYFVLLLHRIHSWNAIYKTYIYFFIETFWFLVVIDSICPFRWKRSGDKIWCQVHRNLCWVTQQCGWAAGRNHKADAAKETAEQNTECKRILICEMF